MSLINGLLALGSLAFVVPLVIHLLYRNRFRVLDWGAMHLLVPVVRTNRRRMQWMNVILLLIRCAIPIVLAFCLARPLLTGFRTQPGDTPRSLVIVIDDSQSMSARDASSMTRLDQAAGQVREIMETLTRRDEVIVIATSQLETPPGVGGPREATRKIEELRPHGGPVSLESMVRASIAAFSEASHPAQSLVIVSDFADSTVGNFDRETLDDLGDAWADQKMRPDVSFLPVGSLEPTETPVNVSIDDIQLLDPAVVTGRSFSVSARIENRSDQPIRDAEVTWSIDGTSQSPRAVTLAPRSGLVVRAQVKIDSPGVHGVSVRIRNEDSLIADNTRQIGIDVIEAIEVAIVDGSDKRREKNSRDLMGEADFLSVALSPFAFGGGDQRDAVRANIVSVGRLKESLPRKESSSGDPGSSPAKVLVLAGAATLPAASVRTIQSFVESGGHLVVFDNENASAETWQKTFQSWPLPAQPGRIAIEGSPDTGSFNTAASDTKALVTMPTRITATYRPWEEIGDDSGQIPLQLFRRREWTMTDTEAPEDEAQVLWKTPNDQPLAIMARRGKGSVTQFAIGATDRWSNWPLRPAFLPMVQQLVLDLAGDSSGATVNVGQEMVVHREMKRLVEGARQGKADFSSWRVTLPDGETEKLEIQTQPDGSSLASMIAPMAGRYTVQPDLGDRRESNRAAGDASPTRFAVVPSAESDLRPISRSELASMAESLGGRIDESSEQWDQQQSVARNGREVWRYLLLALLVLLFVELWWQQRSTSRASAVAAPGSKSSPRSRMAAT